MGIFGLDLSLTGTGISDGVTTMTVPSRGSAGASLSERALRLSSLRDRILAHLAGASLVVVEGPAFASKMGSAHDRSGLWWMVVSSLEERGIPVVEVAPAALKKYATGRGNADKGAVIEAVTRRFPGVETMGDDNRADALVLVAMGNDHAGHPLAEMPAVNRSALESVRWS